MTNNSRFKFRAWNKIGKKMLNLKRLTTLAIVPELGDGIFLPFDDDIIIMQSTGLTDINGKLIFEGDITETEDMDIGFVVFNKRFARFNIAWPSDIESFLKNGFHGTLKQFDNTSIFRILGNIYEDKNLLKDYTIS
jgi:uncharacterized phage protein (TIGR01671 family)